MHRQFDMLAFSNENALVGHYTIRQMISERSVIGAITEKTSFS